ncbi:hypothetical protein FSP39_009239 [Pinctada imbricata]|uniref:Uncharacterized protein n=1 Tax=Pinctada imbricata TaxID=66713 RepID=A0AA88XQY8_PINIB|nr:hypothetical protein FSP39_009239 [Pinctada imbricata]
MMETTEAVRALTPKPEDEEEGEVMVSQVEDQLPPDHLPPDHPEHIGQPTIITMIPVPHVVTEAQAQVLQELSQQQQQFTENNNTIILDTNGNNSVNVNKVTGKVAFTITDLAVKSSVKVRSVPNIWLLIYTKTEDGKETRVDLHNEKE